jgi:hypothetical protein
MTLLHFPEEMNLPSNQEKMLDDEKPMKVT